MIKAPDDRKYTRTHEWARPGADGVLEVGVTDFAQEELGDIVFVDFPQVGARFAAGDVIGTIESVKAVSDLYAPVAGVVVAINDALPDHWESINEDAFSAWLYKLKADDASALNGLLDGAAYAAAAEEGK